MLFALALVVLSAEPAVAAQTAAVPYVAVFVEAGDTVAERVSGKVEVDLAQRLEKKGAQLVDLVARFPSPKLPTQEGDQLIKDGKEAYDNLDMEAAIQKLTDAALFFIKHPDSADPKKLAEVFLFLGAAELQTGNKTAPKEFARAVILDPELKPDPKFFAADVQKAFTAARTEVATRGKALVLFETAPSGATVELLGKPLGLSPLQAVELPAGRYHVRATRPGFVSAAKFPEVGSGDELDIKLELTPLPTYAPHLDLARKLTNRNNFDAKVLPSQAKQLGADLQARYLVLATVTTVKGSNKVEAQVWDVETGDRLRELKWDADEFGMDSAAETIKRWIDRPAPVSVSEAQPNPLAETLKKPWVWAVVGVLVIGGAATAGIVAARPNHRPDFTITGIP